ncbi:hypothetical protein STEG23_006933 [Scotinomys teguina]
MSNFLTLPKDIIIYNLHTQEPCKSIQVQAFKVESDRFGSVEECMQDGNNMLIPIAVGGTLAGLVLNVLIAYLIGRKKSHAGYQTI